MVDVAWADESCWVATGVPGNRNSLFGIVEEFIAAAKHNELIFFLFHVWDILHTQSFISEDTGHCHLKAASNYQSSREATSCIQYFEELNGQILFNYTAIVHNVRHNFHQSLSDQEASNGSTQLELTILCSKFSKVGSWLSNVCNLPTSSSLSMATSNNQLCRIQANLLTSKCFPGVRAIGTLTTDQHPVASQHHQYRML